MLLITLFLGCFNDCSYYERCDGDTLLVCGESADQQVNRKVNEQTCEAPNAVCVEVGDDNATCASAADPCDEGAAATCDGDVLVICDAFFSAIGLYGDGSDVFFPQATDCAATGAVCDADAAACVGGA
ncbi:MAG: hypothetical protein Q7U06_00800 [Pseudomonadota bacterium]|nr:hypothetical protein [Pseudomonadota bacterium]